MSTLPDQFILICQTCADANKVQRLFVERPSHHLRKTLTRIHKEALA